METSEMNDSQIPQSREQSMHPGVGRAVAWTACFVALGIWCGTVRGAEGGAAAAEEAGQPTEEVTIIGKEASVEKGERSVFEGLPPRDLVERPLSESPGLDTATSIVGQEEIEWLNAYTVQDALKYVPGAWTETRGRNIKQFFSVRGQRYPYPEFLIDGAWFREFHETTFFFDAANAERLEVLRSSGSLLLSPGGMVGLINIVPRTYVEPATRVRTEFGTDNMLRTHVSHGQTLEGLSYALGAGFYHTDGPNNMNARENMADFYGRLSVPVSPDFDLTLTALHMRGERQLKLAEPPASSTFQTREDSFDPMRYYYVIVKGLYHPHDRSSTEVIANYGKRRFHGHRKGEPDWLEEDYEYGLRAIQSLHLSEENILRFSGMYNRWKTPTGKRFYVGNPGDLETYAGAVVDEHDFGRLKLNAGYRYSRTYVHEFGGFNVEGSARGIKSVQVTNEWEDPLQTVSVGGSYQLTDALSLHGNVACGEIAARPGLLNADLEKPGDETRLKYDLGIKRAWDGFGEVALTAFYVDQRDAPLTTSDKVIVDEAEFVLYENADRENYGLELDARTKRFDNGLQAFFNAVVMQTRREKEGDWVEDREVPDVILGGGFSYLVGDFDISMFTKHVSPYENERYLPSGAPPAHLGSFTELNAVVSYYFGGQKQHRLYAGVDNITDREYSTVAGYPNEGRKFKVGLALEF